MSERMRGGLFNALGDIEGLTVLDAFGGSGALSIEAISRGAKTSQIVEVDKAAFRTIEENIIKLNLNTIKATHANVSGWSDNNQTRAFDLVLCNPPFDALKIDLIQKLSNHVEPGGLLVLCWPDRSEAPRLEGLNLATEKQKSYGDAKLIYYRQV